MPTIGEATLHQHQAHQFSVAKRATVVEESITLFFSSVIHQKLGLSKTVGELTGVPVDTFM